MANNFWNFMTAGGAEALGSLFGHGSDRPFKDAMEQYNRFGQKGENALDPFLHAGQGAIPDYQKWLQGQQDPSGFINKMMGQYQESPWAKFQQQQANRAGINAGSANGMSGSTPMIQQMQQNSANISSQDMGSWLQNVLGINTQYGQGQQHLMDQGQNAGNSLANMWSNLGNNMGEAAFGRTAGRNQDYWNRIGGGIDLAKLAPLLL